MPRFPYNPYNLFNVLLHDDDYYYNSLGRRDREPVQQPAQVVQQAAPAPNINVVIPRMACPSGYTRRGGRGR
jgi:hypothetical protein